MKKNFFVALTAIAAIVLVGCKKNEPVDPTPEPGTTSKVVLNAETLELSVGDEQRLRATLNPVKEGVAITFTSDDREVATVTASGIVTAVGYGSANIIASAEGYESDTCVVTVSNTAVYNEFNIAGWGLFGQSWEMIEGTDTTLTWEDGTKYDVQLGRITLVAWDGDLVYSSAWAGAGLAIVAPITFWIITNDYGDGSYNGYYIGHGGFEIYDIKDKAMHGVAPSGAVNVQDYGDFLKSYIAAQTSEDVAWDKMESAFQGAQMIYVDYSDSQNPFWSDSYGRYYGHIVECVYYDPDKDKGTEAMWGCLLNWHDFTSEGRYFGLAVNLDAEGKMESVKEPYDFQTIERTFFSDNWPEEPAAPRKARLVSPATIVKEVPAFASGKKALDKMYKK